jgi:uncharacterized protein YndB with AHSA1/START domain
LAAPFTFDREFAFPLPPDQLWATLSDTKRFPQWWSWLRRFEADGLREGAVARCVIQAPLPYALRFAVHVERAVPAALVDARISGDLEGPARLEIAPDGEGSTARLTWSLQLRDPVLRRIARVARPVMSWAHDRVVDVGVHQFEQRALDGRAAGR